MRPLPDSVENWTDLAPATLVPYLRLARIDRPIGWWLLLLPCLWSASLAAGAAGSALPDPWHCLLFLIGAVAMRGAGSTYNDWVDRDLDAKVERTRHRPLPSGAVEPAQALIFLGLQGSIGLLVLIGFNTFTILLGMAALVPVAAYPFMKRIMPVPQLVLGLAFSWGALMGWAALFGELAPAPVLLYAAAFFWVIGYDTIYALQDLEDDEMAGIHSSARFFGEDAAFAVSICYLLAIIALTSALVAVKAGPIAYLGALLFALHLVRQTRQIDRTDGASALRLFRSNRDAGLILWAGLLLDGLIRNA